MHKLQWPEVWNCKNMENEKDWCYTSSYWRIRDSDKEFWYMVGKVRIWSYGRDVTETMFAWNSENNT